MYPKPIFRGESHRWAVDMQTDELLHSVLTCRSYMIVVSITIRGERCSLEFLLQGCTPIIFWETVSILSLHHSRNKFSACVGTLLYQWSVHSVSFVLKHIHSGEYNWLNNCYTDSKHSRGPIIVCWIHQPRSLRTIIVYQLISNDMKQGSHIQCPIIGYIREPI